MSSKKQKCFESSPKEAMVEDVCIINGLPPEIILRILSNLSHGDLLWCRLVCAKWNDVVRTDPNFLLKSLIRVCANSENKKTGGDILQYSNVNWKHLHLIDVKYLGTGTGEDFPVDVPNYLREEVQTLKISHSKMPWNGYQQILTQFPSLKELKIKRAELFDTCSPTEGDTEKELVSVATLQSEFGTLLNKLTSFSISDCEIAVVNTFLNQFQKHLKCLTTFAVKVNTHDDLSVMRLHGADFYQGIFEVIHANSRSLKKLEITILGLVRAPAPVAGLIENSFENVIRRLIESPTASSSLNLDTIYLRYEISPDKLDQEALVQFLKMNKNLKRVCLPETSEYLGNLEARKTLVEMLMTGLSKEIVQVEVPATSYFQAPHDGSLLNFFDKLEVVQIHQAVRPSDRLLHGFTSSHVRHFGNSRLENVEDVRRLTDAFPNLVHLKATIATAISSTAILQNIYEHMRLLVSLELTFETWGQITDSDVTGIRPSHCKILRRLNPKSFGVMDVPAEEIDGLPLSSLQRLEALTIVCKGMRMTDVGLCFGFRFTRLKHLNLRTTGSRGRITPVGLNYLADFNKCLERVTLDEIVRAKGLYYRNQTKDVEAFKLRLNRCKHFRMDITLSDQAALIIHTSNATYSEENGTLTDYLISIDSQYDQRFGFSSSSSDDSESDDTSDETDDDDDDDAP